MWVVYRQRIRRSIFALLAIAVGFCAIAAFFSKDNFPLLIDFLNRQPPLCYMSENAGLLKAILNTAMVLSLMAMLDTVMHGILQDRRLLRRLSLILIKDILLYALAEASLGALAQSIGIVPTLILEGILLVVFIAGAILGNRVLAGFLVGMIIRIVIFAAIAATLLIFGPETVALVMAFGGAFCILGSAFVLMISPRETVAEEVRRY